MFTARAAVIAIVMNDATDSTIISARARVVSGSVTFAAERASKAIRTMPATDPTQRGASS